MSINEHATYYNSLDLTITCQPLSKVCISNLVIQCFDHHKLKSKYYSLNLEVFLVQEEKLGEITGAFFFPLKTVCGIGEQQDVAWNDVERMEKSPSSKLCLL